jgi:hypothetical protein
MRRHALSAGSYLGSLGRYHQQNVSAEGASVRDAAVRSTLRSVGISGLGAGVGDLCSDDGFTIASLLVGAAGSALTSYGGAAVQMPENLRASSDPQRPLRTPTESESAYNYRVQYWQQQIEQRDRLRQEWTSQNQVQDSGWNMVGQAATGAAAGFQSACAARQQNNAQAQNQFESTFGPGGSGGAAPPPPPPAETKSTIDTTTLLIIGGVALAAIVLLRK